MWEILIVGGQKPEGGDATNDLSYMCLEVANRLKTTQPVMAVRVWEGTPEDLIKKGCEMIQDGQANPGFFNDNAAMKMALEVAEREGADIVYRGSKRLDHRRMHPARSRRRIHRRLPRRRLRQHG